MKKVLYCVVAFSIGLLISSSLGCTLTSESSVGSSGYEIRSGAGLHVGKGMVKLD
jgi:hypothetical protein|tara:strand:+ start:1323 stop:1487 length:165 start_codon:yes stop_codon:yes gene_type:complete